ncbi:LAFA_0E11364g1_1 [Lachancea sp. 'fantastica']|nr:LAFA_0E11364g1_1 [Lachancea sp. 'fantastica']
MSFNGIGLKSAKGSSTSGHIQRSLASNDDRKHDKNYLSRVKKSQERLKDAKARHHKKDDTILKHVSRREVELRVSEYRDKLEEDAAMDDATIEAKCEKYRQMVLKSWEQEQEDEKLRNAYISRSKRTSEDTRDAEK